MKLYATILDDDELMIYREHDGLFLLLDGKWIESSFDSIQEIIDHGFQVFPFTIPGLDASLVSVG